ncbi:MAG: hypothetical protein EBY22_04225, partial [Gammaproteobacteria bacterium]|nr:hypothetical protein [Gammaproteobacteria bacterium]
HLPSFQVPKAKKLAEGFFISLLVITGMLFALGLLMIMQAEVAAVMGLITMTGYHVKVLATIAAYLGGAGATLKTIGMFSPKEVSKSLSAFP